jgi:hypothetical protein
MGIPSTVYVALGAIAAAFITGAFSFVNLIISKDQKTSEFRQNWIDRLREDITAFTSQVEFLSSLYSFTLENNPASLESPQAEEFVKTIHPSLREIANMHHRIKLRLNPKEHQRLINLVTEINGLFSDIKAISSSERVEGLIAELVNESQSVLKGEWKRVKRGEVGFVLTKYSALTVFVAMLLLGLAYAGRWITVSLAVP